MQKKVKTINCCVKLKTANCKSLYCDLEDGHILRDKKEDVENFLLQYCCGCLVISEIPQRRGKGLTKHVLC